jgi:hypothetical protein
VPHRHHIEERSPDVRVIDSLGGAKSGHGNQDSSGGASRTCKEEEWRTYQQSSRLSKDSPPGVSFGECIGHNTAKNYAQYRRYLQPSAAVKPSLRKAHVELLVEVNRNPTEKDGSHEICANKNQTQYECWWIGYEGKNATPESLLRTIRIRVGSRRRRFLEADKQQQHKSCAERAKDFKGIAPAVPLG